MMLAPRLTWIALGVGLLAVALLAAPFVLGGNPYTHAFGERVGHAISTAWGAIAAACGVLTALGRSIAPAIDAGRPIRISIPYISARPDAPTAPPSTATAEKATPIMSNLFTTFLEKFVAPEERAVGAAVAKAYAANKPALIAALQVKGTTALAHLKADADLYLQKGVDAAPEGALLWSVLGGNLDADVNAIIDRIVAGAGGEAPIVEAYADGLVAGLVKALEAA